MSRSKQERRCKVPTVLVVGRFAVYQRSLRVPSRKSRRFKEFALEQTMDKKIARKDVRIKRIGRVKVPLWKGR
jgi:hypothetical protein